MPEGDTIFRSARTLDRALSGRTVTRFESVYPHLARVDADAPIAGRRVERASAAGKHLLLRFSGNLVLRTHLRMSGSWHVYRRGERWRRARSRARIVLETDEFVAVGFDVPEACFHRADRLARSPVGRLGPDLLSDGFDAEEALRRLKADPAREIGEALVDQRAVAGVGNELKSEVLFVCRVDPFARVGALSEEALRGVVARARELLLRNVAEPALTARRTTGSLDPRVLSYVYGRAGRRCRRCGTAVALRRQGPQARSTYFCPRCQPPAQQTT